MYLSQQLQPWGSRWLGLVFGLTLLVSAMPTTAASVTKTSGGIGDDSRALGVAHLCQGVIRGIARNPSQLMPMQRIYAAGLKDLNTATRFSFSGSADIARAIGLIRGTQAEETQRQPEAAVILETQAKQCLGDLKTPKLSNR